MRGLEVITGKVVNTVAIEERVRLQWFDSCPLLDFSVHPPSPRPRGGGHLPVLVVITVHRARFRRDEELDKLGRRASIMAKQR